MWRFSVAQNGMSDDNSRHPFLELDAQRMRIKRHGGTLAGASSPLKITTSLKDRCSMCPGVHFRTSAVGRNARRGWNAQLDPVASVYHIDEILMLQTQLILESFRPRCRRLLTPRPLQHAQFRIAAWLSGCVACRDSPVSGKEAPLSPHEAAAQSEATPSPHSEQENQTAGGDAATPVETLPQQVHRSSLQHVAWSRTACVRNIKAAPCSALSRGDMRREQQAARDGTPYIAFQHYITC